ncbi:MAG: uracil-DNA glycosylase [Clostridia bacterium]
MIDKFNKEMSAFFAKLYGADSKVLVFGAGDVHAQLMLIGEAPGAQETLKGIPFVGKAGKNLDEFLQATGFVREELYITNTVKFRPVKRSSSGNLVNRPPTREEVALFLPWLKREMQLIAPRCVVTLGNTALQALMGRGVVIGDVHGMFQKADGQVLFPLYHPASLIYNRALMPAYQADLQLLSQWRAASPDEIKRPSK